MCLFLFPWKFSCTLRTYYACSSCIIAHLPGPHHHSSEALTSPCDCSSYPVPVCTKAGQLKSPLKLAWTNCFTLHCDRVKTSVLSCYLLSATEAKACWNWTGTQPLRSKNWCHENRLGLTSGLGIVCFPNSGFSWASSSSWVSAFILFISLTTARSHFQHWCVTWVAPCTSSVRWGRRYRSVPQLLGQPGFLCKDRAVPDEQV